LRDWSRFTRGTDTRPLTQDLTAPALPCDIPPQGIGGKDGAQGFDRDDQRGLRAGPRADGTFAVSGPNCDGWPVNHVIGDNRSGKLWAGGGGDWFGAAIWHSRDGGATWAQTRLTRGQMDDWAAQDADFAAMIGWQDSPLPFDRDFAQIWSLHYANGRLYAGTKPADLLESRDDGASFVRVAGLGAHPSRPDWNGGAAGLILHSIASDPGDPDKLWVGISAAGVFATEDGGATWDRRNRLSNAEACGHHHHPAAPSGGEIGHCVHNLMRAPDASGDVLYQQNHHGVWRSHDGGRSWEDVTAGLPSTFGFPVVVHPHDPQKLWVFPLNGDMEGRFPPRRPCSGLAFQRRGRDMARPAQRTAARGVFLHGAASGNGERSGRSACALFRDE
jgi:hypothetical protein